MTKQAKLTITEIRTEAKNLMAQMKAQKIVLPKLDEMLNQIKSKFGGKIDDGVWTLNLRDRNLAYDDNYSADHEDLQFKLDKWGESWVKKIRDAFPYARVSYDTNNEYGHLDLEVNNVRSVASVNVAKINEFLKKLNEDLVAQDKRYEQALGGRMWFLNGKQDYVWIKPLPSKGNIISFSQAEAEAIAKRYISLFKILGLNYEFYIKVIPARPKSFCFDAQPSYKEFFLKKVEKEKK
jgi:hypothetical protein